jgi:hypothetical protein
VPDDSTGDSAGPEDHPATSHEDEIKEAAARPADSGEDIGPSAQR